MTHHGRLREMPIEAVEQLCRELTSQGYSVFEVGKPTDERDFLQQARLKYPLDPPISGNVHWDAFADSIWGGLDACCSPKIVLVVRDASDLRRNNPSEFALAIDSMLEAMEGVEAEKHEAGEEEASMLLVVGEATS
ncbi:MAG: hypothetical protein CL946_04005 [Ectothiorhodospiraceae bacterium]|nr:hypothetical protein [Ectothiorhodospiraceae bacterium]